MAGQTKGTYRSKSANGSGIPEPPVIDFAWLKMWWPETSRREPHAKIPEPRKWKVISPLGVIKVMARTKSEARAEAKKVWTFVRFLPTGTVVLAA